MSSFTHSIYCFIIILFFVERQIFYFFTGKRKHEKKLLQARQRASDRSIHWEKVRAHKDNAVSVLVEWCSHEFIRQTTQQRESVVTKLHRTKERERISKEVHTLQKKRAEKKKKETEGT